MKGQAIAGRREVWLRKWEVQVPLTLAEILDDMSNKPGGAQALDRVWNMAGKKHLLVPPIKDVDSLA